MSVDLAQLVGTAAVAGASAYVGARLNDWTAQRRYVRERADRMLPAVRTYADLLQREGEIFTHERPNSEIDRAAWAQATAEFNSYRHLLPVDVQTSLDADTDAIGDNGGLHAIGEWEQSNAAKLKAWYRAEVARKR